MGAAPCPVVLGITGTILAVEVIGAFVSGSLALLAGAGHMLTDAAGLSLALVAAVLFAVGGFVLTEAIRRLIEPSAVASGAMVIFGVVGAGRQRGLDRAGRRGVIALTGWDRADAVVSLLIG